ncbi:hypothetical protein [Ornithinibacillus halotolerans]|uniref:Uncharacterized protein n=1 Tax=Ornithinibacillus halotolerans TaxID=1274357 RepID=A0A916SA06_9BACI|nr:hypothetical protein [Ornithinibacillus halotolerans]GGA90354.1 hypothetical protein GCM10008025_36170 [Ornithinibacillus halotolerans]
MKRGVLFVILFLIISLVGCQNKNLDLTEEIMSIEVYVWKDNSFVTTIEDKEWIDELIEELNKAITHSTADMDYPSPDYKLIFKNAQDEDVFQIGYFIEVVKLGVKGRYVDVYEDVMYKVDLKLP